MQAAGADRPKPVCRGWSTRVLEHRLIPGAAIRAIEHQTLQGSPADMKLKSCATLSETVAFRKAHFGLLLDAYCDGERDAAALRLLAASNR